MTRHQTSRLTHKRLGPSIDSVHHVTCTVRLKHKSLLLGPWLWNRNLGIAEGIDADMVVADCDLGHPLKWIASNFVDGPIGRSTLWPKPFVAKETVTLVADMASSRISLRRVDQPPMPSAVSTSPIRSTSVRGRVHAPGGRAP